MNMFSKAIKITSILLISGVVSVVVAAQESTMINSQTEEVVLGGGCFWCIEAVYERINGVHAAVSGYSGGSIANPSYKQVVGGKTGHIEVVKITFDSSVISLEGILDWFWRAHDPTSIDRQGADVGPQYRSAVFYGSEEQKRRIEASIAKVQSDFSHPIVTKVQKLESFYTAENYHQDYYEKNKFAGYCQLVIRPKLKKLSLDG